MKNHLRTFVNKYQDDWCEHYTVDVKAYLSATLETTSRTPVSLYKIQWRRSLADPVLLQARMLE